MTHPLVEELGVARLRGQEARRGRGPRREPRLRGRAKQVSPVRVHLERVGAKREDVLELLGGILEARPQVVHHGVAVVHRLAVGPRAGAGAHARQLRDGRVQVLYVVLHRTGNLLDLLGGVVEQRGALGQHGQLGQLLAGGVDALADGRRLLGERRLRGAGACGKLDEGLYELPLERRIANSVRAKPPCLGPPSLRTPRPTCRSQEGLFPSTRVPG